MCHLDTTTNRPQERQMNMAAPRGSQNKKIAAVEAEAVLASVKDLDLNSVVNDISGLQVSVQNTLAGLSATLTNKVSQIQQVDTAISLKEARLSELFQIEKEAVSIDDLKAQKAEEEAQWQQQRAERDAEWVEEQEVRDKSWKREEEEHAYAITQAKKRAKEEFDAEVANNKRAENARVEALNKGWAAREDQIAAKESEFADLKDQVESFDSKLKSEISKAEAILGNTLKRQYEHETALLKKDMESERTLHNVKVAAMNETITNLENQIADIQSQLSIARADAKEVATAALNSASGRQVTEALQKAMDTQNQGNGKTK